MSLRYIRYVPRHPWRVDTIARLGLGTTYTLTLAGLLTFTVPVDDWPVVVVVTVPSAFAVLPSFV